MAAKKKSSSKPKKAGKKKAAAKKAGKKKAPAKKAGKKKAAAKKAGKKKAAAKKAGKKKAAAKKAPTKETAAKKVAPAKAPGKTPAKTPAKGGGGFSALEVNMGHIFSLRPRVPTSFRQDHFREARHALSEDSFKNSAEAARAVADKALELTHDGVIPGRGRNKRRF
jgi:hypothetical protein